MKTEIKIFTGRKAESDASIWANQMRAQGFEIQMSLAIDKQNTRHISIMATLG